ncbi:MAG: O-antigen ligase family protein [Rhodococcus sp. (in: high G+C Gram-positive bacteria)]
MTSSAYSGQKRRDSLRPARNVFYYVYIACTLGTNTVLLIPRSQASDTIAGGVMFQASWILLLGLTVVALLTVRTHNATNFFFALMICGYIMASAIWSVNPTSTLTYGALFCGNILVAYMLTCDYRISEILKIFSRVILFLTVAGLAAYGARLSFSFYFDHQSRANLLGLQPLRGLFPHKITGGLYAVMGAVLALNFQRGLLRTASLAVYSVFVILTGSASAIILGLTAVLVSMLANTAVRSKIRPGVFAILFLTAAGAASVTVLIKQTVILELLGRDSTLTGRTYLWQYGLDEWRERPLFGWGFNGYFTSDIAQYIQNIGAFQNYNVPHFHQSYIQTMVDLGLVGLLIMVAMITYSLYWSYRSASLESPEGGAAAFTIVSLIAIAGLAIYVMFEYNHFATFALFTIFFGLRSIQLRSFDPKFSSSIEKESKAINRLQPRR